MKILLFYNDKTFGDFILSTVQIGQLQGDQVGTRAAIKNNKKKLSKIGELS